MLVFDILLNIVNKIKKAFTHSDENLQTAKDYTDITQITNESNISLNSGFSLASWGSAVLSTYGKINILTLFGFRSNTAVTSAKIITKLDGSYLFAGGSLTAGSTAYPVAITRIDTSGNIYVDAMSANVNYYGQLVFLKVGGGNT